MKEHKIKQGFFKENKNNIKKNNNNPTKSKRQNTPTLKTKRNKRIEFMLELRKKKIN